MEGKMVQEKMANKLFVKFIFPVSLFRTWDGNLFNTEAPEWYEYRQVHVPYQSANISADSSVQVVQRERFNALEEIYREEVYARNIGMVYRRTTDKRSTRIGQEIPDGYDCIYYLESYDR